MSKKIIGTKRDDKRNISAVRLEGNKLCTPIDSAVKMAERGEIQNAHAVHPGGGRKPFLRSNPDKSKGNNIDEMAEK